MRIALFVTCLNDALFPQTGKAVVALRERLGHTVEFPGTQTCCGQMHYNSGYHRECVPLSRAFADTFAGYEAGDQRHRTVSRGRSAWAAHAARHPARHSSVLTRHPRPRKEERS